MFEASEPEISQTVLQHFVNELHERGFIIV